MKKGTTTTKIRDWALEKLRLISLLTKETQLDILDKIIKKEWEKVKQENKDRLKEIFD